MPGPSVLHSGLPAVVGMAGAAKILAIIKTKRIAAMIRNPDFGSRDVIDFSRRRAPFAEDGNAAKRIVEKDDRDGVLAPVLRVIELLEPELPAIGVALAQKSQLAIILLMGFTVR